MPAARASANGGARPSEGAVPNTIVTSYNRNFPRRNDGQPTTMNFIGSPEIVTAMALAGRLSFNPLTDTLTDAQGRPFRLDPPKAAPEVPAHGFDAGHATYIAPPEDGSGITLAVDPNSERLQLMEPWLAWDHKDFVDCPVLIKTQGKTTTDHISPAGPVAALSRPSRQVQRQHVHGRHQRLYRRDRHRASMC